MKVALLLIGLMFLGGCEKGEEAAAGGIIAPFPDEPTEILVPSTQIVPENKSNHSVIESDPVADPIAPNESVDSAPAEVVDSAPAEVVDSAPAEVVDSAPAEVVDSAPAEVVDSAPAEVVDSAPAEVVDSAPAEVVDSAPADQTGTQPTTPAEDQSQPEVPESNDNVADDEILDDSLDPNDCGFVMISPHFALINFSCIPGQVKKNKGKFCGKYLKVVFQTPNGRKKHSCKKVNLPNHVGVEDQVVMELEP